MNRSLGIFFLLLTSFSCGKKTENYVLKVPSGWPQPSIPQDKNITSERLLLGRKLFYDPMLSADGKMSCASCHKPKFAFADSTVFSGAHDAEVKRNTPSIFNVAWYPYFFAEGGVPTIELVSAVPIQSKSEMGFNIGEAVRRLSDDEQYVKLFREAYDTLPSTYTLVRALGAFQRSLISGNSRYDRYINGNSSALSSVEKRGRDLFFSDSLHCASCHSGVLFTDFGFYQVGLPSADVGRYRLTGFESDKGKFKTPSLRNVSVTAPYMHDGSLKSLQDVITFYEMGDNGMRDKKIKPFHLSLEDKQALIAFLQTLTDSSALNNPEFLSLEK